MRGVLSLSGGGGLNEALHVAMSPKFKMPLGGLLCITLIGEYRTCTYVHTAHVFTHYFNKTEMVYNLYQH